MSNQSTPTPADTVNTEQHKNAFGRAYWMLNSIEMFERLAYFGIRAVVPLYIMQATEPGGLHLSALTKGWIYAWWAVFQSFLPIVTGGFADRYGYKRVLFFAISANVAGLCHDGPTCTVYYGFFAGILVLATGTAFFKPSLQGSIAQNLTKANSSVGWGVFYWVVNVGAFGAPFISTAILGKPHSLQGWQTLFYACAAFTAVNLLLLLTFKDVPSGASKTESPWQVLKRTIVNIWEVRLITWLLIMSCFWLMMYQLWDLHPNFITDWVDSSEVARYAPEIWQEHGDRGLMQVPQQILLNLNAGLIILLMVPLSWASRHMRTLSAMLVGMSVATCGVLVAGLTSNAWFLLLGIVFFSLGEMWTGPKKNEYLGLIAPAGKKGLYLGYVNIPVGIGLFFGSLLGGWLYDHWGEKATLALKELAHQPALIGRAAQSIDWSDSLDRIPELLGIERKQAFVFAQQQLGQDAAATTDTLRRHYRYDKGQIDNLAYIYLARNVEKYAGSMVQSPLENGVDGLAEATGVKRAEVFSILRQEVNVERSDEPLEDEQIIAMLWDEHGNNPEMLNLLALEYLGQGTPLLRDAIAEKMAQTEIKDPVEDIERLFGIGRTKSFFALSAALAATEAEVEAALADISVPTGDDDRVFAYLAGLPHTRFIAVARRDWTKDVALLEQMIESSPAAKEIVVARIDEKGIWDYTIGEIINLFSGNDDQSLYQRLAEKPVLIRDALARKDWSQTPVQARQLLQLSGPEARTRVAVEVNHAAQQVTQLLWDNYYPQYKVWIPFAAIGVMATIALGIFGQMAKRWKDMNA